MSVTFARIVDSGDPRLRAFREALFEELGAKAADVDLDFSHRDTYRHFEGLPPAYIEELWKFGRRKWAQVRFDALECAIVANRVVSLSGCRKYSGGMLRVAMHLYTLRAYRRTVRNIQFSESGFFARHLAFAREVGGVRSLFFTVYPHSKKLQSHVANLAHRKISPDGGKLFFVGDLEFIESPINFHGVDQFFFIYKLDEGFEFNRMAPEPALEERSC